MTTAIVTDIAPPLAPFSTTTLNMSLPQSNGAGIQNAHAVPAKDSTPFPVDTVSLSFRSRQALPGMRKDPAIAGEKKQETKNEGEFDNSSSGKPDATIAKVQFVYTMKGTLRMRYLDTSDRLIYQNPSELMLQMKEAAAKAESSVNTTA